MNNGRRGIRCRHHYIAGLLLGCLALLHGAEAALASEAPAQAPAATGPVRVFALLKRRNDISVEAFSQHWGTRHAEASLKLTGYFDRYVQNHFAAKPLPGFKRTFDGGAELWYPNLQRSIDLGSSPEYMGDAYHDNFLFQDVAAMRLLNTKAFQSSPDLQRPVADGMVKVIVFWSRRAGLDAAAFEHRFRALAAPALLPAGHYAGFERGMAFALDGSEPEFDAFEQVWWPNEAAFAQDAAALTAAAADATLFDAGDSMAVRVREMVWYWPPQVTGKR